MKNKFIIALLLLTFTSLVSEVFGQIIDFREYQRDINSAELLIVDNNEIEAFNIYYNLLVESNGNFTKDIYNSLILATKLSEKTKFYELLNLLLTKNLSSDYIENDSTFIHFHNDEKWNHFINRNNTTVASNVRLRNSIDSMFKADQIFRGRADSYTTFLDTIIKIDSSNLNFLSQLIINDQFPSEDDIGVNNFNGGTGYDIIFHHNMQSTNKSKNKQKYSALIIGLARSGKIPPNRAAYWIGLANGDYSSGVNQVYRFKRPNGKLETYVERYSDLEKAIVNAYRDIICAESLSDYYKKVIYVINHPNSRYLFDIKFSMFELDDEMINRLTSKMNKLE